MNVIELTRELGKAIQQDERYKKYMTSMQLNDTDVEIQNKIGRFNQIRSELSEEMRKDDKDADKLTSLDTEMRELYEEINNMPKMVEFYAAKDEMDKLMNSINYILQQTVSGEDPMTCEALPPQGCTGSCASCGGCG